MVTSVTSFGRSGLYDWLLQRFTAVVLLTYVLCVGSFLLLHPHLDYVSWQAYYTHPAIRVFSLMALISLVVHAWIGMWSVSTDYITVRVLGARATLLRVLFQGGCGVVAFAYLVWGVQILWSN